LPPQAAKEGERKSVARRARRATLFLSPSGVGWGTHVTIFEKTCMKKSLGGRKGGSAEGEKGLLDRPG